MIWSAFVEGGMIINNILVLYRKLKETEVGEVK